VKPLIIIRSSIQEIVFDRALGKLIRHRR
jgi:hypothetical protein